MRTSFILYGIGAVLTVVFIIWVSAIGFYMTDLPILAVLVIAALVCLFVAERLRKKGK